MSTRTLDKRIDYLLTVLAVHVCAGDVPFPKDYGEGQPAEVFALLWESARTTGETSPDMFISCVLSNIVIFCLSLDPWFLCLSLHILSTITKWFSCMSLSLCLQSTRQERTLMKPFYDRYRLLKQLLLSSAAATVITTIVSEHLMLNAEF